MAIDNVPDFYPREKPTAEKFNLLRDALLQQFFGGIVSSNIQWPLVAQGVLDMNNNDIINIGSLNNIIHVNSAKSLTEAVDEANTSGGNSVIVVDPSFQATSSGAGVEVTVPNVTIMGHGPASTILADGAAYGVKAGPGAVGFQLRNIKVEGDTAATAVLVEANNAVVSSVAFQTNQVALEIGSSINTADGAVVAFCTSDNADYPLKITSATNGLFIGNSLLDYEQYGVHLSSAGSYLQDLWFINNHVAARTTAAYGAGVYYDGISTNVNKKSVHFRNNKIVAKGAGQEAFKMEYITNWTMDGDRILNGQFLFSGEDSEARNIRVASPALCIATGNKDQMRMRGCEIDTIALGAGTIDLGCFLEGNRFNSGLPIGSGVRVDRLVDNHVVGNISNLIGNASVYYYAGNTATGSIT